MKFVILFSLLFRTAMAADLIVRDIIFTSSEQLLLRQITDPETETFLFEECGLSKEADGPYEGHGIQYCEALTPRFRNNPMATAKINELFERNLKNRAATYNNEVIERSGTKLVLMAVSASVTYIALRDKFGNPVPGRVGGAYKHVLNTVGRSVSDGNVPTQRLTGRISTGVAWLFGISTLVNFYMAVSDRELPSIETTIERSEIDAEKEFKNNPKYGPIIYHLIRGSLTDTVKEMQEFQAEA